MDQATNEEGEKREEERGDSLPPRIVESVKMFHFPGNLVGWRPEVTLKPGIKNVPTRVSRGLKRFSLRLKRDSSPLPRIFRKFDGFVVPLMTTILSPRVLFRPETVVFHLDRVFRGLLFSVPPPPFRNFWTFHYSYYNYFNFENYYTGRFKSEIPLYIQKYRRRKIFRKPQTTTVFLLFN